MCSSYGFDLNGTHCIKLTGIKQSRRQIEQNVTEIKRDWRIMLLQCGVCPDTNIFTITVWQGQRRSVFRGMDLKFETQVLRAGSSVQKHNSEIYRKYYCHCHKFCHRMSSTKHITVPARVN
jgi:hypothetical protein